MHRSMHGRLVTRPTGTGVGRLSHPLHEHSHVFRFRCFVASSLRRFVASLLLAAIPQPRRREGGDPRQQLPHQVQGVHGPPVHPPRQVSRSTSRLERLPATPLRPERVPNAPPLFDYFLFSRANADRSIDLSGSCSSCSLVIFRWDGLGVTNELRSVLNAGVRSLFFNGQYDLICNHVSRRAHHPPLPPAVKR